MIEVNNLSKSFDTVEAVKDVSFAVKAGEIFAFLGPNGAGKTTTIKMLTTLLRPSGGSIRLDGLDPVTRQNEVRKRFGIVFQDPSLDQDLTAWENMQIHGVLYHVPRAERLERSETLLKLFDLWDRKDDAVKTFSGGMRRRLEIARGFLHTPKILFLDEPTLGLDPRGARDLRAFLRDDVIRKPGRTAIVCSNDPSEARALADRVLFLEAGKLHADAPPDRIEAELGL